MMQKGSDWNMNIPHKTIIPEKGLTVLSLCDGMSCGRIALERAGFKVKKYYASEIKDIGIKVAQENYPDIIHIGDVNKVSIMQFHKLIWLFLEVLAKLSLLQFQLKREQDQKILKSQVYFINAIEF